MARYRTFWQDFFRSPIYYEAETKFSVSICKSFYVHVQTNGPTASKFGKEILEMVFEKTSNQIFLKIDLNFFE